MNIASTQFTLKYQSFELYLSGCVASCKGCFNPELKDFTLGIPYQYKIIDIENKVKDFDMLIKHIWILGGDPMDQNINELEFLLSRLIPLNKKIWLWTRYSIKDVPDNIKNICDFIKTGEFISSKITNDNIQFDIKLASSNQKILQRGIHY